MNELDRLYENLILHPDDHLTLAILWNRLLSTDSDTRRAVVETLTDYCRTMNSPTDDLVLIAG